MKILHVNKFFDLHGGAEVYMHRLMEQQSASGHEVHAFSTRSVANIASADSKYFVKRYEYGEGRSSTLDIASTIAFVWNREAKQAMTKALVELRPDMVHLHNIYHHLSTSILAPIRASGIPCVQTLHDYKLACPNYKMLTEGSPCERCKGGKYFEAVKHRCLTSSFAGNMLAAFEMGIVKGRQNYERTVRAFICPSRFMAEKMIAWGEPASKMHIIANPVESSTDTALGDEKYVLAIGRLSPEKGFDIAIRAIAAVPGVELRIAGSGPQLDALQQCVQNGTGKVVFQGFADIHTLAVLRRHARAVIVPSLFYENAPLVVLEALAQGVPIIASRIGGLPELIEDGVSGYLVSPGDAGELAVAISRIMKLPPDEWNELSTAARARAKELYGWKMHQQALETLYHEVA